MKIGFDARLINESGVGRYIRNVLPLIIKKNRKNKFIITVRSSERKILEELVSSYKDRVEIIEVKSRWHTLFEQIEIPLIFYKRNVDVLHVPYINVPIFYLKRLVVTIHDLTVLTHKTGKASTHNLLVYNLKHFFYKIALKKALTSSAIFTVTNTVKNEILDVFPKVNPDKIIVTYNGFSPLPVSDSYDINNIVKPSTPYFFYIGNAHPHKNLKFLVDTLSKFFEKFPRFKMILAGRNDYFMSELREYTKKKKMSQNFIFVDSPTDEELYNLYKKSRLVLLPSLKEGFGMQILEAMQLNCLLVLSNISAYREVSGNLAFYFQPDSKRSLIIALNKALRSKPTYKKELLKKYKVQLSKFSWQDTANDILRVYENRVGRSKKMIFGVSK